MSGKPRVCMLIQNEVVRDGRVRRAASTIAREYDLTILGADTRKFDFDREAIQQELGCRIEWMPMAITGRWPRNAFGYCSRYAEIAIRAAMRGMGFRPDLLHVHEWDALPVAAAIRASCRCKVIYDAHELYRDTSYSGAILGRLDPRPRFETWFMRSCDGIIACNHHRAEIMRDEYGAPFLPTIIRNVSRRTPYEPSDLLRRLVAERNPAIRRICLYQGAITAGRQVHVFAEAMEKLPDQVGLVMIGPAQQAYLDRVFARAREKGTETRILHVPPVPQSELLAYTRSADVGMMAYSDESRNNYYCAPNKLFEYSASRLPMVGSDLPPIREFLEEYGIGAVCDTADPNAVAQAIRYLLGDDKTYERCRENCVRAAEMNCWEIEEEKLLDLYTRVLS